MQFHLNGFRTGDPAGPNRERVPSATDELPNAVDVLIVGSGPTGLTLAAQLANYPNVTTCLVEQKQGPLSLGQADGIACRTMEMFESFGFAERVLKESYWVNETTFWKPDDNEAGHIVRGGRIQDTEDGLSEFPHVILNQARVHDFFLETMRQSPSPISPHYSRRFRDLHLDKAADGPSWLSSYPITVRLERTDGRQGAAAETIRCRFVVGCDGARSDVRKSIGRSLTGDSANQAWGVMDVLAVTDFPDIRRKCAIHSARDGSVLIIPREGGYLVRLYIEFDKLDASERIQDKKITADRLIVAARRILRPYTFEVKEIAWWSVYEIGPRQCDRFDDLPDEHYEDALPRVFIAGDACHTHSPKAGQGMNVSMQDGFNLGWKLAAVLSGRAHAKLLLSYSEERVNVARELIDFDRRFAKMFSAAPKTSSASAADSVDPAEFRQYFVRQGRFTAGTATCYGPSLITADPTWQRLASGYPIGMRFHSEMVTRLADSKPVQLGHVLKADGRWRLMIFSDHAHPSGKDCLVRRLCTHLLEAAFSPIVKAMRQGEDIDAVFDVRAIFPHTPSDLEIEDLPALIRPRKGRFELIDYEKAFCSKPKHHADIYMTRGIAVEVGCVVIVRPDQYVAAVLPLDQPDALGDFFDRFMLPGARDRVSQA